MPQLDESNVLIERCYIVWDGLTQPEQTDDGKLRRSLKLVIPPGSPDADLVNGLAMATLQSSKWNGTLPAGANWAVNPVKPGEFNDMFAGGHVINPSTLHMPQVYDDKGNVLQDQMQWAQYVYQGQCVSVIVNTYSYDNKAKGIKCGLQAVRLELSMNAPRQQFGGGGYDAGSVFGGNQQQPMQQGGGYNQGNQQQPMQQGGQQQPMQQGGGYNQGNQQQPMQQGGGYNQGNQQQPMQQGGQQQPMQQATNFLPNQQ